MMAKMTSESGSGVSLSDSVDCSPAGSSVQGFSR